MALKRFWIVLCLGIAVTADSSGQDLLLWEAAPESSNCRVTVSRDGKWRPVAPAAAASFFKRQGVFRAAAPVGRWVQLTTRSGQRLAIDQACLRRVSRARSLELGFSLIFLQEPLTLTSSVSTSSLFTSHIGGSAQVSRRYRFSGPWHWGWTGALYLGRSEVAESSAGSTAAPVQYRVNAATLGGGMAGPTLSWISSDGHSLGLWVPVGARFGNWPDVADGSTTYRPGPLLAVTASVFLRSQIRISSQWLVQWDAGFYRSFSSVSWTVGAVYAPQ